MKYYHGIEDILQGKEDVAVYQRLQNASFDERLSVVNLLLSGLNRHFAKVADLQKTMDAWYASLKQMQQEAEAGSEEAAKTFAAQKPEFDQKQEQLIRRGRCSIRVKIGECLFFLWKMHFRKGRKWLFSSQN